MFALAIEVEVGEIDLSHAEALFGRFAIPSRGRGKVRPRHFRGRDRRRHNGKVRPRRHGARPCSPPNRLAPIRAINAVAL